MIKQYLIFAVVLLIGVFILTEVEWGNFAERVGEPDTSRMSLEQTRLEVEDNRSDLSMGRSDSSINQTNWQAASSSSVGAATSTRLQSGQISANPFSPKDDEQDLSQLPQASANDFQTTPISGVKVPTKAAQSNTSQLDAKQAENKQTEPSSNQADKASETSEQSSEEEALPELQTNIQISGHVLDSQGKLIAGIPLSLELLHASAEDSARFGKRKLNTRSNEKGIYAFLNLVEGDYRVCTVNAKGYRQVCQKPRAPHLSADISLTAIHNGRIYGEVKDAQGRALKEVTVSAVGQQNKVVTDESGHYNLPMAVNKNMGYQIFLSKPDYRRERIAIKGAEILANKKLDVALSKLGGFDVSGVVRDQAGNPVEGLTMTLKSPSLKSSHPSRGISNQDGNFLIQHVEPAKDYRLSVSTQGGYVFDDTDYKQMEVYQRIGGLQLAVRKVGTAHFSGRVVTPDGAPLIGEQFTLYSDANYGGQSKSDTNGQIEFANAFAELEGSKLKIFNSSTPKYTFSGITLSQGETQSGIELLVDRGGNSLQVTVVDAETPSIIQGAQGILTWTHNRNGVMSQTTRIRKSREGTGRIDYSELSFGAHQLRVSMQGYRPYTETIEINQASQQHEVKLLRN